MCGFALSATAAKGKRSDAGNTLRPSRLSRPLGPWCLANTTELPGASPVPQEVGEVEEEAGAPVVDATALIPVVSAAAGGNGRERQEHRRLQQQAHPQEGNRKRGGGAACHQPTTEVLLGLKSSQAGPCCFIAQAVRGDIDQGAKPNRPWLGRSHH